jgi:hypothetical protein
VQLDELFAVLCVVKTGEVSEAEVIERLERSPHWVWVAMDPESKWLLSIGRRRAPAGHSPTRRPSDCAGVSPDCASLFLTNGFKEYTTALLTHYGQ